jgi:hypothetical protein
MGEKYKTEVRMEESNRRKKIRLLTFTLIHQIQNIRIICCLQRMHITVLFTPEYLRETSKVDAQRHRVRTVACESSVSSFVGCDGYTRRAWWTTLREKRSFIFDTRLQPPARVVAGSGEISDRVARTTRSTKLFETCILILKR